MTRHLFLVAIAALSIQACSAQTPTPSSSFSTLSFNDLYSYAVSITGPGAADQDAHNKLTRDLLFKGWPVTSWGFPLINGVTYDTQVYTYSLDPTQTLRLNEGPYNGYKFAVALRASTQDLNHYLEWFHAAMALQGFNIDPVALFPGGFILRTAAGPHSAAPKNITFEPEFTTTPGDPSHHADVTKPFTYTMTIQIVR